MCFSAAAYLATKRDHYQSPKLDAAITVQQFVVFGTHSLLPHYDKGGQSPKFYVVNKNKSSQEAPFRLQQKVGGYTAVYVRFMCVQRLLRQYWTDFEKYFFV